MRPTLFMLFVLFAGCGHDTTTPPTFNVQYGDFPHEPPPDVFEQWFHDAIACADKLGPPERRGLLVPFPVRLTIVAPGTNDPYDGLTYYVLGAIAVEQQWAADRGLLIHEYVHWILYNRGVPVQEIREPEQPEFFCRWAA